MEVYRFSTASFGHERDPPHGPGRPRVDFYLPSRAGDPVPASLVVVRRKEGSQYGLLPIRSGRFRQRNAMKLGTSCGAFSKIARCARSACCFSGTQALPMPLTISSRPCSIPWRRKSTDFRGSPSGGERDPPHGLQRPRLDFYLPRRDDDRVPAWPVAVRRTGSLATDWSPSYTASLGSAPPCTWRPPATTRRNNRGNGCGSPVAATSARALLRRAHPAT